MILVKRAKSVYLKYFTIYIQFQYGQPEYGYDFLFAYVRACMSEKENASYVNLQRSFSHENQQTHMKWVCTIYLQHQRILKNQI